jgi:cobalt-zinc-cadmium efflux system protein
MSAFHHHGHGHTHGHGHIHGHCHSHSHGATGEANRKNLIIALIIIGSWMFVELIGGLWTRSLALLADAAHMFSDFFNLLISLIAIMLAAKATTKTRTFGNHRYEILAALFNSVALLVLSVFIIVEAWKRMMQPQEVLGGTMMIIAAVGLVANLGAMFVLMRGEVKENLNMRGAFLHVLGDALGSVAGELGDPGREQCDPAQFFEQRRLLFLAVSFS